MLASLTADKVAVSERLTSPVAWPRPRRLVLAVDGDPIQGRIVQAGYRVALALVLLQTFAQLLNALILDKRVWAFSADADGNALSWLSSSTTFAAALLTFFLACSATDSRRLYFGLAAVLAFFSLDDIVAIHEDVGTFVRGDLLGLSTGWGRLVWPVIFFPLLATVFIALLQLAASQTHIVATAIRRGLALLVLAVLAEAGSTALHVGSYGTGWPDAVQVAVEEGLELGAWIMIVAALAAAVRSTIRRSAGAT